jgi:hypothetical protein
MSTVSHTPSALEAQTHVPTPTPDNPTEHTPDAAVNPAVEQAALSAEQPSAEQAVAAAAQAAEEQAAAAEEQAREEADTTLKALVKAFRQGERAYRQGLLDAGRLCDEYVRQRLTLGDKRSAAVQCVEGELAKWSSSAVNANQLIGSWHAYRLLAVEQQLDKAPSKGKPAPADGVAYGHYRDAWCRLVERKEKDTAAEHWVLLPGLEAECREAFAKAVQASLSKDAASDAVRLLVAEQAKRQADQAKAAKETADKAAVQAQQQAAAENAAVQEAIKAQQQAASLGDPEALKRTAEELQARQRAAVEATARAEQAQREADAKAKADKAAAEAAAKAAAKLMPKTDAKPAEQGKATAVPGNTTPPLPTVAEEEEGMTPERAAAEAAVLVVNSNAPDDATEQLLDMLVQSKELCPATTRALQAALVLIRRVSSPSPAEIANAQTPNANGALVGAA